MSTSVDANHDNSHDKLGELAVQFDSTRVDWETEGHDGSESDIDLDDLEDEEFTQRLVEMAMREDEIWTGFLQGSEPKQGSRKVNYLPSSPYAPHCS